MMTERLRTVAPDLAEVLASAGSVTRRMVASALAEHVIERTGVYGPAIQDGLEALRSGSFGQTAARAEVHRLAEGLDEQYLDMQDAEEQEEAESQQGTIEVFSRARATAALDLALDEDPYIAACEALYEGLVALNNLEEVRKLVIAVVGELD